MRPTSQTPPVTAVTDIDVIRDAVREARDSPDRARFRPPREGPNAGCALTERCRPGTERALRHARANPCTAGQGRSELERPPSVVHTENEEGPDDARPVPPRPGSALVKVVYFTFRGLFADNPRAIYEALLARGGDRRRTPGCAPRRHRPPSRPASRRSLFGTPEAVAALEAADVVVANDYIPLDCGPSAPAPPTCRPGTAPRSSGSTTTSRCAGGLAGPTPTRTSPAGTCCSRPTRRAPSGCAHAFGFSGADPRDRLPAQRRPEPPGPRRGAGPRPRPSSASPTARRPSSTPRPGATTWCSTTTGAAGLRGPDRPRRLRRAARAPTTSCCSGCTAWSPDRLAIPPGLAGDRRLRPPRIRELYLAADVLVTDYSSAMFDFAVTGKPHAVLHLRPRALPRRAARLLLRPRRGGPRPAACAPARNSSRRSPTSTSSPPAPADRYARFRDTFCSPRGRARHRTRARPALPARRHAPDDPPMERG